MKFSKIIERKEIELNLSIQFFYEAFHRHKKAEQIAANPKSFWEFFFLHLYVFVFNRISSTDGEFFGYDFREKKIHRRKKIPVRMDVRA